MKKVLLIGAGNIGSRHLQALKAVNEQLKIFVVDPNPESLKLAKERYEVAAMGKSFHEIIYSKSIPDGVGPIDLGIIATCSNIRADATRKLLEKTKVKYLVLEKLLFDKKRDYDIIGRLLKNSGTKAWVNCPMRMMPAYGEPKKDLSGPIYYSAVWSGYGLVTSAIHYVDHLAFLANSDQFLVDTSGLSLKIMPSKRNGFLELTGSLRVLFKNGSIGNLVCFEGGNIPILVQFHGSNARYIVKETEQKTIFSKASDNWVWSEANTAVPFQSQLTNKLAESLFKKGTCELPSYEQSKKIHLQLLEPLRKFLNKNSKKKYNGYPFT